MASREHSNGRENPTPVVAWLLGKGRLLRTREGTPQGGIISPVLANLTLDGMEKAIRSRIKPRHDQVNFIRYADDFVVTARTKETLETMVKPAVVAFLAERGLELSEQKTTITHIQTGFNFLGQNVRKYRNKLVIKPAKEGLKALVQKTRECIKGCVGQTAQTLINKLNPMIRGWANYHRYVCSAEAFWTAERIIQDQLYRWARRTHPHKSYGWLKRKYFSVEDQYGLPPGYARKHRRKRGVALVFDRPDGAGMAHQGQRRGQPL